MPAYRFVHFQTLWCGLPIPEIYDLMIGKDRSERDAHDNETSPNSIGRAVRTIVFLAQAAWNNGLLAHRIAQSMS